jgi:WYL domain
LRGRAQRREICVRLRLVPEHACGVRERPDFFQTAGALTPQGFDVTLCVRQIEDAPPWALSWGARVQALTPPGLIERVQAEARAMLDGTGADGAAGS